ncbi:riboflavin synthase [Limnobacter humi]|uniref:Riboflavin synthase n=1 Tax=Limnobacter humi TaxID=1778671 RepID=A0ABT1WK56_9BURK|nr:riboflavin synthase [Limnobacter humi]MCQ8896859.1 riboflavin synthase [Limnobacter humi]
MFTGIIESIGTIESVSPLQDSAWAGVRLAVHAPTLDFSDVKLGDSIAIQGACMTVVRMENKRFWVDVSQESLSKTVGLAKPGEVNLEKAMRLSDRVGGHLVSGHVDGLGHVVDFSPVGESWHLQIRSPKVLSPFFAYKGSVTVNGVSLTVNKVDDLASGESDIHINLIPHTVEMTTLKHLQAGSPVNLEIDQIARYCERIVSTLNLMQHR